MSTSSADTSSSLPTPSSPAAESETRSTTRPSPLRTTARSASARVDPVAEWLALRARRRGAVTWRTVSSNSRLIYWYLADSSSTVPAGHERQRQAPARWPATLRRGGVLRVTTRPTAPAGGKREPPSPTWLLEPGASHVPRHTPPLDRRPCRAAARRRRGPHARAARDRRRDTIGVPRRGIHLHRLQRSPRPGPSTCGPLRRGP